MTSIAFTGIDANRPGYVAKTRLRDYIRQQVRNSGQVRDFDCALVDELESEAPNGKPLISIHTASRRRKTSGGTTRIEFTCEIRVMADGMSGAFQSLDELLSDDIENQLDNATARRALEALGLEGFNIGERRENVREGQHVNSLFVSFSIVIASAISGGS